MENSFYLRNPKGLHKNSQTYSLTSILILKLLPLLPHVRHYRCLGIQLKSSSGLIKSSRTLLDHKTMVPIKNLSIPNDTIHVTTAEQCGFVPCKIPYLPMGQAYTHYLYPPVSAQGEATPALITITQSMPVLETGNKILQTVDTKYLPSNEFSDIDNHMGGFQWKELVYYLCRTRKLKSINDLRRAVQEIVTKNSFT